MHQLKTAIRLALCVGLLASAAVWAALLLGVLKNPATSEVKHRITIARYVSLIASSSVNANRKHQLKSTMEQLVLAEPSLVSIGIRNDLGLLVTAGPHEANWPPTLPASLSDRASRTETKAFKQELTPNQISVELVANGSHHGHIELTFNAQMTSLWDMFFGFPVPLAAFIGAFVSLASWVVFERSFKYLDPSRVVPDRVRAALDTMAEGVVLLDTNNEIGHANDAFSRIVRRDTDTLLGTSIHDYQWAQSSDFGTHQLPWSQALQELRPVCGVVVRLILDDAPTRKFIVNATPIVSSKNECRGVLVSLEDVTAMENKKHELSQMISTLRQSRDEVERQNVKLNFLASYDQLTECMNRREFFKRLEAGWADKSIKQLSVIMLDVDHFKSVNDNHGHGKGDEVLRTIGSLLRETIGDRGVVARIGGEEFAAMVPHMPTGPTSLVAEEIRAAVGEKQIGGLSITISLGISGRELMPMDTQHLLDQADQALYAAKTGGRNRVVRYDQCESFDAAAGNTGAPRAADQAPATRETSPADNLDPAEAVAKEVQELVELSSAEQSQPDGPSRATPAVK